MSGGPSEVARRLDPVDTAFLAMETPQRHMHAGGLFVFEPPQAGAIEFDHLVRTVDQRLDRVPRYRWRLAFTPLQLGAPVWVDDNDFDLSYHVRHVALPAPGTTGELTEFCARILSRPLDRARPLWELYVIEGLEDGRFALLAKTHHAMLGGDGGLDLATVLFDDAPAAPPSPRSGPRWRPSPPPSDLALLRSAAADALAAPGAALKTAGRATRAPWRAARAAARAARGVAGLATRNLARPAPRSLLNREPTAHRRLAVQRLDLDDVKFVKDAFGTAVHDVVLALVTDATGRLLRRHGADTERRWVRVLTPVAVASDVGGGTLGSRVVSGLVDLPVFEMDPVERLRTVAGQMQDVVDRRQPLGAELLLGLGQFAPPTLHGLAGRVAARSRLFNLVVTNVPGPQRPVYCLDARLRSAFPFPPLSRAQTYAVGVTSTGGSLNVGVTADYEAWPDVESVGGDLTAALAELVASADAKNARADLARASVGRRRGPDRQPSSR